MPTIIHCQSYTVPSIGGSVASSDRAVSTEEKNSTSTLHACWRHLLSQIKIGRPTYPVLMKIMGINSLMNRDLTRTPSNRRTWTKSDFCLSLSNVVTTCPLLITNFVGRRKIHPNTVNAIDHFSLETAR